MRILGGMFLMIEEDVFDLITNWVTDKNMWLIRSQRSIDKYLILRERSSNSLKNICFDAKNIAK